MNEPKKLKIALISDWFLPRIGGIELHVRDLALNLKANGQEVHVITTTPGDDSPDGIPVHRLKTPLLPFFKIAYSSQLIRSLREILVQNKFDILHSHSSVVTPLAYVAIYLANELQIPSLITNHSLLEKSVYFLKLLDTFYGWKKWPVKLTSISTVAAEGFIRASGEKEITLLPNGIDTSEWKIIKNRQPSPIQITTVMRLHPKKRGMALIEAIKKVKAKLSPSFKFQLNLIGDGKEKNRLEKKTTSLKLQEEIKFLGYRSREEIKKLFEKSHFFVLPTVKEAFGIAVLEAKAAGLPVVAMSYGGVQDMIEHQKEGFLANNDEEFADYILELIQNEKLRNEMSENTIKTLDRFDWRQLIQKHWEVYQDVIRLFDR